MCKGEAMTWPEFYKDRLTDGYHTYFKAKYAPFLMYLEANLGRINGEFGCGIGTVTKLLKKDTIYQLIDKCPEMLELTHQNLVNNNKRVILVQHDITEHLPRKFSTIYSHGVLEHFDELDVVKIISHQQKCSNKLIHYVPSYKYVKPSFGDERLKNKEYWKQFGCHVISFNNEYDYILVWK